uniref:DUF3444 domain-containing protein n=2 Tax=Brassica oleracea var. oleracea TaxID=109376 RepID=A0A0D3AM32_BRAOL
MDGDGMDGELKLLTLVLSKIVRRRRHHWPNSVNNLVCVLLSRSHKFWLSAKFDRVFPNNYSILPKTGDVWAIYRNWSNDLEAVDLKSQTYDLVEVLDDKLDYKVLLLAPDGGFKSADSAGVRSVYMAAAGHWTDGADVRFTIPKCEMLRFSHQVTTSRVTKEVHGTWQEVYEPAIEALLGLSCAVGVGEKRKMNEHGESCSTGYDGLKFNDFEKLRKEVNFSVGQTWALYDKVDGMPRLYARIRKVSTPTFGLRITYLEPDPDDEKQIQWLEEDLPVSAGINTGHLIVSPRKGETWALFKNWDINWSSQPDSHRSYEYEFVEITLTKLVFLLHSCIKQKDIFRILPHRLYQFSHSVPFFKLTGIEGVPKDAYELDKAALPETIEDTIIWSFCSGHEFPLYYGKIQKITFTRVLHQKAVYKLHVRRLKPACFPLDVIQYEDKKMPVGCGTYYARNALEIITTDDVSHQVVPETSIDGNEYTILPKIGEVWVIYRFWSEYMEFRKVGVCSYDVVQVLDDTLGYKVLLLEREPSCDDDEESLLFREVTEYKHNEIDGSEPIFTITNSERLRFSHKAPARRVTKEIYGELKDLIEVDSGALAFILTHESM